MDTCGEREMVFRFGYITPSFLDMFGGKKLPKKAMILSVYLFY